MKKNLIRNHFYGFINKMKKKNSSLRYDKFKNLSNHVK